MENNTYKALVVDDEPAVRNLTVRSLRSSGVECDVAVDGRDALERLLSSRYDVVITDVLMPNMHGHALAVDLLEREDRPMIVVLTGVLEPKITRDLLARGVDDVCFKPVDYRLFAAKVKALLMRRTAQPSFAATPKEALPHQGEKETDDAPGTEPPSTPAPPELARSAVSPISLSNLRAKLEQQSQIQPISPVAIRVSEMARQPDADAAEIAHTIERDPSLAVHVLKLANSAAFNRSRERIASIDEAVVRIGLQKVGEVAITTSTLLAFSPSSLSWMNMKLIWERTMAAATAVKALEPHLEEPHRDSGLFLAALTHLSGRIVLATLYPDLYRDVLQACERETTSLRHQEKLLFGLEHTQVMAELVAQWDLPASTFQPVKYILKEYGFLRQMAEPLRTKVALLKLAVLVGRLAVGRWETRDTVELPPPALLNALSLHMLPHVVETVRQDLVAARLLTSAILTDVDIEEESAPSGARGELDYVPLISAPFDALAEILTAAGIELSDTYSGRVETTRNVLVNGIGAKPKDLALLDKVRRQKHRTFLVLDRKNADRCESMGRVLCLPASYGALDAFCREAAQCPEAAELATTP
jgi:HD-like signal output (HDOD) protein/DNA-binding NarL/FixJ family response regulator